ncbi:MAG: DUF86 domain-containing protein [Bacteroidales bacterium]|nr:DUF86 domain-containing protein [Bacteroidales bacterium]
MRERVRDKGRLEDIRHYSEIAENIVKEMSYNDFVNDVRSYFAVMKTVEIVGEAAYMLTKEFKDTHPETPWDIIQGMRHILVHGYASVNALTLYETTINNIPELRKQVEKYLEETDWKLWAEDVKTEIKSR